MKRADFLKLALLAPLARLFGWKAPEPPPLSWPLVFEELGEPTEYTVEYVTDYLTDGSCDWVHMPYSDGPGTWDSSHTASQWVIRTTQRGRGKLRTIQQSVRRL